MHPHAGPEAFVFPSFDPLFELQLQIARRADEFAHLCATAGTALRDREMWQQAEAECLRRLSGGVGLASVRPLPAGLANGA